MDASSQIENSSFVEPSFEILIRQHRPMLLSYATTLLQGNSHQAEDVVQETCVTAYRKLNTFRPDGDFPKWLRGILRNKVLESQRQTNRHPFLEDPEVIEGMEDVFCLFDHPKAEENWNQRLEVLKECVAKLKKPMRSVVELFYQRGFSLNIISSRLSISAMTAGQRLSRARKLIRKCIETKLRMKPS